MATNSTELIEQLKSMTLIETTELVAQIEKTFGVVASAPVAAAANISSEKISEKQESVEEKTSFNVILQEVANDKRIAVLKTIRTLTSLGLKEAKEFTTGLPKILKEAVSKESAETALQQLQQAGATAKIE